MKSNTFKGRVIPRLLTFYLAGLCIHLFVPNINISWLIFIEISILLVSFFIIESISPSLKGILLSLACIGFGLMRNSLSPSIVPDISSSGYVVQITEDPIQKQKSYKAIGNVIFHRIDSTQWQQVNYKILLYFTTKDSIIPQLGHTYFIQATPKRLEEVKNPDQFDYKKYLEKKGIFHQQFLRNGQVLPVSIATPFHFQLYFKKYAHSVKQIIQDNLEDKNASGVVQAMITGSKEDIDRELTQIYSNAGAVHVLAVSGMHVGIIYIIGKFILDSLFLLLPRKWQPAKSGLMICTLVCFACFTGLSPSVVRATLMFIIIQCATFFHRASNSESALLITALLLLVVTPSWLFDIGFQLSFLAVWGIIKVNPLLLNLWNPQNPLLRFFWGITAVGFSAQFITFPLTLYYFHQFPTYFFLSNPIVSILASPILILAISLILFATLPFTSLTTLTGSLLNTLTRALNESNQFIASLPWAVSGNHYIDLFECIVLYVCILWIIRFFYSPSFHFFQASSLLLCIFCVYNIYDTIGKTTQQVTRIHQMAKSAGISIISGKYAVYITNQYIPDSTLIYEHTLKSYYIKKGINKYEIMYIPDSTNAIIQTRTSKGSLRIHWVANPRYVSNVKKDDVVIISNNSKVTDDFSKSAVVIVDESNKRFFIDKLMNERSLNGGILFELAKTGSFQLDEIDY